MGQKLTKKIRYSKISFNVRKRLINRVLEEGFSITSSAKLLKIKVSTAKAIVRKYKKTGKIHIGKKEQQRNQNQVVWQQVQEDAQTNNKRQYQIFEQHKNNLSALNMHYHFQMQMQNFNPFQIYYYQWQPFYYHNGTY